MNDYKWLIRKYPHSCHEILDMFDHECISYLKKEKYKLGRLVKDHEVENDYKKGMLFFFKRSNPINSYNYPAHHGVFKCQKGYTASGYHSVQIWEKEFKEIKE